MKVAARVVNRYPHAAGLVFAALAAIVYGLHPPAEQAAYSFGANAVCLALFALWSRGLGLMAYCIAKGLPLFRTREDIKQALIGGACQAWSSGAIIWALMFLSGPIVIIIVFAHTLMLLFFMAWRGEIKLDFLNIATTVMALFGLTLVLDVWHAHEVGHWIGALICLSAALATASRLYVYGHQTRLRDPIVVGAENMLIAAILTVPAIFLQMPRLPETAAGGMYIVVICLSFTAGAFFMFWGISLLGAFQYSLMAKIEPIFTALFSVLLLKEVMSLYQYIGMAFVLSSLAAYQILRSKKKVLAVEGDILRA